MDPWKVEVLGLDDVGLPLKNKVYELDHLKQVQEELQGLGTLVRGNSGVTNTKSEGSKQYRPMTVNKENEMHLDPGKYSVSPKMISRNLSRTKLKRKEDFRVGWIKSWNEFFNGTASSTSDDRRGREEGELGFGNKKYKWKVYSRRRQKIDRDSQSSRGRDKTRVY